jgi:hypothetical protein
MKGMSAMSKNYDMQMFLDWFQQCMGELKVQQLQLDGQLVPPGIERGVSKFRNKWGGRQVVPDFETFEFTVACFQGDEQQERQKLAEVRKRQFETVMAAYKTLEELGVFKPNRQEQ